MGRSRRSSEEHAAAPGVLTGHTGVLRHPAADLMIPGAAGASVPRIGPRPQSLRVSDPSTQRTEALARTVRWDESLTNHERAPSGKGVGLDAER